MSLSRKRQRVNIESPSTTEDSSNDGEVSGKPHEDEAACELFWLIKRICERSPSEMKGVCWLKQVYEVFSVHGKTWVDSGLAKLCEAKLVRLIVTHAQSAKFGVAVLLNEKYVNEVRLTWTNAMLHPTKASGTCRNTQLCSALSKYIAFLEKSNATSVTLRELQDEHSLESEECSYLVNSRFILPRRDVDVCGVFWVYWPYLARVIAQLTAMRTTVIDALRKLRYKEISEVALVKLLTLSGRTTPSGTGSPDGLTEYYVLDLLGNGLIHRDRAPGGKNIYRLRS